MKTKLDSNSKKIILIVIITFVILISGILIVSFSFCSSNEKQQASLPEATDAPKEESATPTEDAANEESGGFTTPTEGVSLSTENLFSSAQNVYYGVYYFDDNTYISDGNSAQTTSASVIKVFLMEYIYEEIAAGNLTEDDAVSGSSLKNLVATMIQNSDNNATNTLLDHFGMDTINAYIKKAGYSDTEFQRKMLDFDARNNGKEN